MRHLIRWAGALALVLSPSLAHAQQSTASLAQSGAVPPSVPCVQAGGACVPVSATDPLPTIGKQEAFALAIANVAGSGITAAGGDYILTQTCAGYGTLAFQVLGPDAATWLPLGSYTAADAGSGHGFSLGSYAQVSVTLAGTTGCNAILSRVPS